jgi:hypothetical protein
MTIAIGAVLLRGDSARKPFSLAKERCGPCFDGSSVKPMFGLVFLKWRLLGMLQKQKARLSTPVPLPRAL